MVSDFKLFVRNLCRNKLYAVIAVLGFAMALMFIILLTAHIRQELSVDQFHRNKDRIFRAVTDYGSTFGPLIGEQLKNKYPEIECYTRTFGYFGFIENKQHEKVTYEGILVDSAFFRMFSFHLLQGDPEEILRSRNSVVLTRSYALKLFGELSVIGKEINIEGNRMFVSGVVEDMPKNTHFDPCDLFLRFDVLSVLWNYPELFNSNDNSSFALYVMAYPGTDLSSKTGAILEDFKKDYWLYVKEHAKNFQLEPLTTVYWSRIGGMSTHHTNKSFILILVAIVIVILTLAVINYNNLSIAMVGFRAKEAAIKKLVGITDWALFRQFITESVCLCLLAFGIAIGLAYLMKPLFDQGFHTQIDLFGRFSGDEGTLVVLTIILLGIISGFIPAWMMVRYKPVEVVKGVFRKKARGAFGKILICFQYTVSMVLIISTLVILKQTDFLRSYDLGFDKENVIYLQNRISVPQKEILRNELMKIPEVVTVSYVCGTPVDGGNNISFDYEGKFVSFQLFKVDSAFFKLMNMRVRRTSVAESANGIYLNETAVRELELGDLPSEFKWNTELTPVLGVVDDFHFKALNEKIGPAIVRPINNDWPWNILVKINSNPGQAYTKIKQTYSHFIKGVPFASGFMDETIHQWYEQNDRMAQLISYFSLVSIILAMMGGLAMATYFIHQRTKEIGLRRVNGATIYEVLRMLIFSFMKWIFIAFIIACPLAWCIMNRWLQDYPYRIEIGWWIYGIVGSGVGIITLALIGKQSYEAATANPVEALKAE